MPSPDFTQRELELIHATGIVAAVVCRLLYELIDDPDSLIVALGGMRELVYEEFDATDLQRWLIDSQFEALEDSILAQD